MNRLGHYARQFAKLAYRYPQSLRLARRAGDVLEQLRAAIVYDAPNRSRLQVEWPGELRDSISRQMQAYPHLEGYTFER